MDDTTPQSSNHDELASRSVATLRGLEDRAHAALTAHRAQIARLESEVLQKLDQVTALARDGLGSENGSGSTADELRTENDKLRQELEQAQADWQLERTACAAELAALRTECESLRNVPTEYERLHETWNTERAALAEERDTLRQSTAELESQHNDIQRKWNDQLTDFEQKLATQQVSWNGQRESWDETRTDLERQCKELQHKFDIALGDVQRFRARVAELEQELARRPEPNQTESAELVALRSERDALAQRVEELEAHPVTQIDAESEQQLADLQRRFEMAVEDVRELKTANAQLEAKLAASRTTKTVDNSGSDWESMKRRLLASLEEAGDDDQGLTHKERISIESTIEMTDALVADKDREIKRLNAELAAQSSRAEAAVDIDRQNRFDELLDADSVIIEHRKQIARLETELQDKLRTAELELSVERARIARQKAELQELQIELDSRRPTTTNNGTPANEPPRRRWLSKLGLSGDDS